MKYVLAIGLLLMTCTASMAGIVRLGWTYEGIGHKGFRLYYGKTSHVGIESPTHSSSNPSPYDVAEEILDPEARSYEVLLPEGTYYFRMVTIGDKNDSVFTKEEPVAEVGINPPSGFTVEWIITKTKPEGNP
jgi:hypothetical protein